MMEELCEITQCFNTQVQTTVVFPAYTYKLQNAVLLNDFSLRQSKSNFSQR